jgi:hypothetical protein
MFAVGAHTDAKPITPELLVKAESLKSQAESELGETFEQFDPTEYKVQVVAGLIYHFKVLVSDVDAVHIKVFEPLPYTGDPLTIMAIQKVAKDDALVVMRGDSEA